GPTTIELPRQKVRLEAVAGLETERAVVELDLTDQETRELSVPLGRFSDFRRDGWYSANTHLHLRDLSRAEADRYLREIPAADGLDVLFISHLERADDDRSYITNQYPVGRLQMLETSGVLLANGEEHRHNFGPQDEGYGHVMLLGIKELVQPVSIGYGISRKHPDAPVIRAGIDTAHEQGGTAIWCHNNWGFEDVPNWLTGKLDAQNIFDGGSHGNYADSFYHYLNAGLRVPFSTGTDWFIYDFARAYAHVEGELTPESWLAALRAGRTFISNGPLLEFRVNASEPGDTVGLEQAGELSIIASARGRLAFGQLELIRNGRVVETAGAQVRDGHYEATLNLKLPVSESCWLAARITTTGKNEYGQPLFAHTSPVYVTLNGRAVRLDRDIQFLLGELESARSTIAAKSHFDNDAQRDQVLGNYDRAIAELKSRRGN
ncbi:MAG: CehA/McbA family metallohydrolase, partial [Planctomycetes bacterium]|nr:CehA/McbA family metallohydrolase [Planctomycetota bacterium]